MEGLPRAVRSQPIVANPRQAAIFLVLTVRDGAEQAALGALADISELVPSVGFRAPDADLACIVGIGSELWDRTLGEPKPAGLHPFQALVGDVNHAPATAGDILLHIRAQRGDLCFELGKQILAALGDAASVVDEVHGFNYFDQRDLLGFVDGTANPVGQEAQSAVYIGTEDTGNTGGSYVIVQKYLHDLQAWQDLTVEAQERVIGRTKLDDIELGDDVKPSNSHVAVNTLPDDANGIQPQIFRENRPFGRLSDGEFGTYFIGYAADSAITERMLRRMFIGEPPGTYDRVLDFSTAVTGSLYYVPTLDQLEALPDMAMSRPPSDEADEAHNGPSGTTGDGGWIDRSLGIGSLRKTNNQ